MNSNTQIPYRPDIDGLRAVAVLCVVVFHFFPNILSGGFVGVDVFFVISGFLISSLIFNSLQNQHKFSFKQFYVRRVLRLFPALLVVTIVVLLFGWPALLSYEFALLGKQVAAASVFISNFVLWHEVNYFDLNADYKPLLHLWSLGIEEQFYLAWPILVVLCWRSQIGFYLVLIAGLTTSFYLNIAIIQADGVAAFYSPYTRAWELLLGAALALYFFKRGSTAKPRPILHNVATILGFIFITFAALIFNNELEFPGWLALLPTLGTVLIIYGQSSWINRKLLSHRLLVFIGMISYPLYLWHWSIISYARIIESESNLNVLVKTLLLLSSFILAWLTYRFIERPLRFEVKKTRSAFILVILMSATGAVGYFIYLKDGFARAQPALGTWGGKCNHLTLVDYADDYCSHDTITNEPRLILIGDSYAAAYTTILKNLGPEFASSYKQFSRGACPSLLDYGHKACREIATLTADYIAKTPSVKTVALAASWSMYTRSKTWDRYGRHTETLDAFLVALERTISHYEKMGKHVVLFLMPPKGVNTHSCIIRPLRFSQKSKCAISLDLAIANGENYTEIMKPVFSRHPRLYTFDPLKYFCNNNQCVLEYDNLPLIIDEYGHLSDKGGEFLAQKAEAELKQILGRD